MDTIYFYLINDQDNRELRGERIKIRNEADILNLSDKMQVFN